MSTPVLVNLDFAGNARCVNHPDPVNPQDVATRAYVLAIVTPNMVQGRIKGRALIDGTGAPQDLTGAQVGQIVRYANDLELSAGGTFAAGTVDNFVTTVRWILGSSDATYQGLAFTGPTTPEAGKGLLLYNRRDSTFNVNLEHEHASATSAVYRLVCPGNVRYVLRPGDAVFIRYAFDRWIVGARAGVTDASVANAGMANMAAATVKLRALGAGSGPPIDGTGAQLGEIIRWTGLEVQSFAAGTHTVTVAAGTTWLYINTTGNVVFDAIIRTGGNGGKLHVLKNNTDSGTLSLRYNGSKGANMIHTPFDVDHVAHGVWAGATLEYNGFEWFIPGAKTGAAESFVGNFGSAAGTVNSRPGTDVSGNGLKYIVGGTLALSDAAAGAVKPQDNQNWVSLAPGAYTAWAITATQHIVAVDPNAGDVVIHGFALAGGNAGGWFRLVKRGSDGRVVVKHQSGTETTATNRTICPGALDYVLTADGDAVDVHYIDDSIATSGTPGTSARWQVIDKLTSGNIVSVSGTQNALALGGADIIECTTTTTINGIAGGFRGRGVDIIAATGNLITVNHFSASAAAADQIALPESVNFFGTRTGLRLVHDGTVWRTVSPATVAPRGGVGANTSAPASGAGSTSNVAAGGTYTIPANALVVGDLYRLTAYYTISGGASLPAVRALVTIGSNTASATMAVSASTAGVGRVEMLVRCVAIGASGSFSVNGAIESNYGTTVYAGAIVGADTTAALGIALTLNATSSIGSVVLSVNQGVVERVF